MNLKTLNCSLTEIRRISLRLIYNNRPIFLDQHPLKTFSSDECSLDECSGSPIKHMSKIQLFSTWPNYFPLNKCQINIRKIQSENLKRVCFIFLLHLSDIKKGTNKSATYYLGVILVFLFFLSIKKSKKTKRKNNNIRYSLA